MGVVIESSVWEPNPGLYIFIFFASLFSILAFPYASNKYSSTGSSSSSSSKAPSLFDHGISPTASSLRFQRNFLLIYSLASVMEGLWSVFGEFELAYYGLSREQMMFSLCVGFAASLLIGSFLGVLSDVIGPKKVCFLFCILHLFLGLWKRIIDHPSVLATSICLSLAASIFSFSFETWMVVQHEEQGHRQDMLSETFWLMSFFESASLIGSQVLSNWLIGNNVDKNMASHSTAAIFLAIIALVCLLRGWTETPQKVALKEYRASFSKYVFGDKRIWLLVWAQACLHFSVAVFWILWAPIIVADGREVHLGLIYPCFLGSRMLGSTIFPWLISGLSSLRTEDCLVYAFIIMGLVLSITAYDYQEIGVLVTLFCIFHAGLGMIFPSLARLRTMYVPNALRGGMISLSQAPANAAILLFLVQGKYYNNIGNSTIIAFAALGLFTAAGCMHVLKRYGKQPYHNWRKL
ncbi:hypothetical protein PRUPE_6G224200 [Prunus persica]|uniref:Major facilitator superfamily (MFS) profile domain-containing protein n=1 Tax=Prunus persica TaxID=3760 RepID=M5W4H1_PRUPE|nr:molybdate-anion transporter [Prunus persica]XP_020422807.1 molybdate-anion transporter [Prunus persica]XP_020422808.1 molybdate-anion transporter [Prunus persica]ONI02829.1 hypothetical protein PRUPE_6G224200 [Prunus persica]ONI02830.1 hypothetical protein PRUPE_6G224200 [Prunus persica]ONI02831.1 hypothetical protein PRUPE_6G224200 [Prunus persica]ONI02832.1 hypothetical protein PRUPE_6G224200 [Prunus persica]ONI02833.1 hypothetical protein PRUPE_6G224200 [Prunus persica]